MFQIPETIKLGESKKMKIKMLVLCAIFLFVFSLTTFADGPPCEDGHTPVGGKCFVQFPDARSEIEKQSGEKSFFDLLFSFFKG